MGLRRRCNVFFFQAEDGIGDDLVTGVQTCVFFFQAEDGIRDDLVTGVQTCALPISCSSKACAATPSSRHWISPARTGSRGAQATKPEAISVPPLTEASHRDRKSVV